MSKGDYVQNAKKERENHAPWRQQVFDRVRILDHELERPKHNGAANSGAAELLDLARDAATCKDDRLANWWNGTLIEQAWRALHDAECRIVQCLPPEDAVRWWQAATWTTFDHVPWENLIPWENLTANPAKSNNERPVVAAALLRAYYYKSDRSYCEERRFRNRLIKLSLVGVAATAMLLFAGFFSVLPIEDRVVSGVWKFVLVAAFGAIGAFLAGLPTMTAAPRRSPYRLTPFQVTLKLSVGPLFALLGILAVQSRLVVNVQPFTTFDGRLLFWAAGLGATQQLLTGLLDRKAASI
jgi:hypothetical protein